LNKSCVAPHFPQSVNCFQIYLRAPTDLLLLKEKEKSRGKIEPIRNRFERALIEFRALHGPNNVLIISFEDIEKLFSSVETSQKS